MALEGVISLHTMQPKVMHNSSHLHLLAYCPKWCSEGLTASQPRQSLIRLLDASHKLFVCLPGLRAMCKSFLLQSYHFAASQLLHIIHIAFWFNSPLSTYVQYIHSCQVNHSSSAYNFKNVISCTSYYTIPMEYSIYCTRPSNAQEYTSQSTGLVNSVASLQFWLYTKKILKI